MGPNASDLGMGIYMRGSTFDAKHMDHFVKSDIHQRFSDTMAKGSPVKAKSIVSQSLKFKEAAEDVNDLITSGEHPT